VRRCFLTLTFLVESVSKNLLIRILISHNLIALIRDFGQYQYFTDPLAGLLSIRTRNAFTSYFAYKTKIAAIWTN